MQNDEIATQVARRKAQKHFLPEYANDEDYQFSLHMLILAQIHHAKTKVLKQNPGSLVGEIGVWKHDVLRYRTITDFFVAWKVVKAETHRMKVPLLRRTVGLGDGFAFFAERLPLWFKMKFNGCLDRRAYWNDLLQFVPRRNELASQVEFDEIMDVRRVLRSRGIDPHNMKEAPKCDVCLTWMATHVMQSDTEAYIVCDKPRCQDRVAAFLQEASNAH
jgi:hypothetical protein